MQDFDGWMSQWQTKWRKDNIKSREEGWQNGKQRAWILPRRLWEEGLWSDIRTGHRYPLATYLGTAIKKHDGVHNLKSSWAHCANLYFPFGQTEDGKRLMAGFLQSHVKDVRSVDSIELEFAGEGELHPSILLGEPGGMRGANQTSPDLGIAVNGGRGLILVENKLWSTPSIPAQGTGTRAPAPDPPIRTRRAATTRWPD